MRERNWSEYNKKTGTKGKHGPPWAVALTGEQGKQQTE